MSDLEERLSHYFGFSNFLDNQKKAVEKILSFEDVVILMPTGGGKSLCYQLPALLMEKMTIVVSPLISLMNEQVYKLRLKKIKAGYLNSSLTFDRYRRALELIKKGEVKILYVAPETLSKGHILDMLSAIGVDFFAIDEAHCISQWGHDFRPEYRLLLDVRKKFRNSVFAAFTGTATKEVLRDVQRILGIPEKNVIRSSFNRPNLYIEVLQKKGEIDKVVEILEEHRSGVGIIYCGTKKKVEEVANQLKQSGYNACAYHGGMENTVRDRVHHLFLDNKVNVVVATLAFGMGIDKDDVRFVIHMDMPKSLEAYYQEIGRAGRDGKPSKCLLFYSQRDVKKIEYLINQGESQDDVALELDKFHQMIHFCETSDCRKKVLLNYFSEVSREDCGFCDNCLALKGRSTFSKKKHL